VVIAETGRWKGNLVADVVVVAGEVSGNITASGKIELLASAKVIGNLRCPVIAIATGAIHEGRMDMGPAMRVERFFEKRDDPSSALQG
jgi:cytoskeletal protein CcmA (bactofilin family)